jgi:Family of unknown function (DUF5941)/CDP-alcohol phosphatidyltransferase
VTTAVLFATAPGDASGPAAALRWEDTTLLGRLIAQLTRQGVSELHVVTRSAWAAELDAWLADRAPAISLHRCTDRAADLRTIAELAGDAAGAMVVANADVLTQDEAFAGLLADPRVPTGILATRRRLSRVMAFGTVTRRGHVMRAGSPYHRVAEQDGSFLGVLKVAAADRPALAEVARGLAEQLGGELPENWQRAFDARTRTWKRTLQRQPTLGADADTEDDGLAPDDVELTPEAAAELQRRLAAAEQDVTALLLHGLLIAAVPIRNGFLGRLFWARPLSPDDVEQAAERIGEFDEEEALLKSAVKGNDGFFTTFFVSPYSKYIARWAARRGWTPNAVTILSMAIGVLAAAAFATGERAGLVAGAVLLQIAFTFDCVDGQLARYTRTFTRLGAWLDSIFDRSKEYAVFAGLAIGSAHAGDDVWLLAGAALALQTVRHSMDFSFNIAQDQAATRVRRQLVKPPPAGPPASPGAATSMPAPPPPGQKSGMRPTLPALDGPGPARWIKKVIAFPIGERFAAISITAALFDARVTFIVLLAWGGFAVCYTGIGRILRSLGPEGATTLPPRSTVGLGPLASLRDEGPAALFAARVLGPLLRVPPVLLVAAALVPLLAGAALAGDGASWVLAAAVVGWAVLMLGATRVRLLPRDRLRWTVLPALRLVEYAGLLWIAALAGARAVPAAFALLCAIAFRHYDLVYRLRQHRDGPPRWLDRAAGGWDGRLIAGLLLGIAGALPAAFYVVAGVLGAAFVGETAAGWARFGRSRQPPELADEEDGE